MFVIPKKIHYVWFGGRELPATMRGLINGWRNAMPDHEIIEWNETNIDVRQHPYMYRMHSEKKYAFASDYARLMVLKEHGGIYMDTDVEVKKSLEPFLTERFFLSFEFDHFISTCIMGCEPGHPLIQGLLKDYDDREDPVVNNILITMYLMDHYPEFRLNNRDQVVGEGIRIFPKEYFVVPSFSEAHNFSQHHANNHWNEKASRFSPGKVIRALIGDVLFFKLVNLKMGLSSTFPAMERKRVKAQGK